MYLEDSTSYLDAYFGEISGPYHLDGVSCRGYEATLLDCGQQYTIGVHNCAPGNEAGVKCDGMQFPDLDFVAFTLKFYARFCD